MATYEIRWIDAFSARQLAGNACAVVMDARGLGDATMLALAREFNLSETAFVFPGDADADRCVRYFTPVRELPLAGHPTIAVAHALVESGAIAGSRDHLRLKMPAGVIPVDVRRNAGATVYAMSQPPPQFFEQHDRTWAATALGLTPDDVVATPPQTVSTGTKQLVIGLASRDALDRCVPDRAVLFADGRDYFSVHVFACGTGDVGFVARHFAEFGDVIEDPFTGSGTGNAAAYAARYGLITARTYDVEQGMHVQRPGRAQVELSGTPDNLGRIVVAGAAVTVMTATLNLR